MSSRVRRGPPWLLLCEGVERVEWNEGWLCAETEEMGLSGMRVLAGWVEGRWASVESSGMETEAEASLACWLSLVFGPEVDG